MLSANLCLRTRSLRQARRCRREAGLRRRATGPAGGGGRRRGQRRRVYVGPGEVDRYSVSSPSRTRSRPAPRALLSVPTLTIVPVWTSRCKDPGRLPNTPVAWASSITEQGIVPRGQVEQVGQRGQVAVHAEDGVGDDQPAGPGPLWSKSARWLTSPCR